MQPNVNDYQRSQVELYEKAIALGKELIGKPDTFFHTLTTDQLSLCDKLMGFIKPSPLAFNQLYDTDQRKIEEITRLASTFQPSKWNWTTTRIAGIFSNAYADNAKYFSDSKFAGELKEFETLTKFLKEKLFPKVKTSPGEGTKLEDLPQDMMQEILIRTDPESALSLRRVNKQLSKLRARPVFEKSLKFLKTSPEQIQNAYQVLLRDFPESMTIHAENTYTANTRFAHDDRFRLLFNSSNVSALRNKLDSETLQQLADWVEVRDLIKFAEAIDWWKGMGLAKLNDLASLIELAPQLKKEIKEGAPYHRVLDANLDVLEVPEELKYLTSLQKLVLSNQFLKELPEFIGDLSALKTLQIESYQKLKLPSAMDKLQALERLKIRHTTSLDFITKLPNLQVVEFNDDPRQVFSPEVIKELESKNLKFKPRLLLDRYAMYSSWSFSKTSLINMNYDTLLHKTKLTLQEMLDLRDFIEAVDTIRMIEEMGNIHFGVFSTKDVLLRFAKEFPDWVHENEQKVEDYLRKNKQFLYNFTFRPEAVLTIAKRVKT